nr:WASH complex subunit 2A isoform X2 [Helicoverpa armigera]XP_049706988.1 WASH complex subunit 2A isoform X3 [Helicoverpa armigera]XP_049706989.1 WASH complex subunit 2A isoform X4 [Helicoverpa armigera]XP_049706990.1 WASH complex subunit 2A isoform X5 [Helicoverpa armigera]XP_049706991.1 WASH complex subunit 2A isoform X6 [Helicoverpa armigera]XP_049706992.1 WASH complex subunit 2A isoform X7 [Helicoverpa armigera]XP_049706993.1 WASH complex subunit 2A isoform X8 [Helicoverpa armigera]
MDDPSTDSLRKLAPTWTLAGDEQLLTILQKTHQRLLSKCQEANSQLEQMTNVLNDASISLQNVNNQFMALSNRQFIESRVYDDDELPTEPATVKEAPKPEVPDELSGLKRSIAVLESAHELITILQDSDTDTQSDDELPARLVLKPKDMYSSRPLPYIIGSQPWKNKWHAGLVVEDSDSESSGSAREAESDQYSASEPEDSAPRARPPPQHNTVTTVSETSSSLASEPGLAPRPTPADVASEIARRLGATEHPKPIEKEPEYDEPAKPTVRKIYRPQDPVSSTVFPDEPPPLSDESEQSDSAESDIFADLHRQQPYARAQVSDELFGFKHREDSDEGDIFSDFKQPTNNPIANASSPMFPNRDTHRDHHNAHHTTSVSADTASQHDADKVKKPVGGISLFGNKGTESIGAAILKRNQRKSSSSDAESESDSRSESQTNQQINQTQKDIFDDLFARSEGKKITKDKVDIVKDIKTVIQKKNEVKEKKVEKVEKPKVDLFSDNLFDDIDDIFSTNVVKMPAKDNVKTKSIFEDDDDLFSEIAAPKPVKVEVATSSNNKKSIFDSDDELFAEETKPKPVEKPIASPKPVVVDKPKVIEKPSEPKITKIPRSIFDDDDDEDDIFSDVKTDKHTDADKVQNTPVILEKPKDFSKRVEDSTKNIAPPSSSVFKSPSLFDDDDDENDLFAEPSKSIDKNITVVKNKDSEKVSIKNEVKISDDILNDDDDEIVSTPVVKSDEIAKDKNDNLNIDSKPIESSVNNNINATESIEKSEDSKPLPVSEQLDRNVEINAAKISDHIHRNIQNIEQSSSDTNDFSDQDFDDLPPKEHNKNTIINTNENNEKQINDIPKTTKIDDIFDTPPLKDDIFASPEQKIDNKETLYKNIETEFPETLLKDTKKTDKDNKTEQVISKNIEADIFSDILTEPPEFEKPKEPKKSKNVNALFDDDSDDESLFFKKNEPIFEENPQDFTPTQDRIFGLFTDEPPDDEFSKIGDEIDDNMFSTLPKPKIPQNENLPPIPDVNFENNFPVDVSKVIQTEKAPVDDIFNDDKPVHELPKETSINKKEEANVDKLTKTVNMKQESPTVLSDDELFKTPTKIPNLKPTLDIVSDDEDIFSTVTKAEKPTLLPKPKEEIPVTESNVESVKSSDDELYVAKNEKPVVSENILKDTKITHEEDIFKVPKSKPEITKPDDTTIEVKSEPKKVGKLKVGLNINVNALLPGASPKKAKPNDQTDGQTQSVSDPKPDTKVYPESPKSEPKIPENQNTDSKMIKSVSFDGDPESDILDNKLSKERAKIQVKRRPSTRRARREAVRKSGIDFGEDSTDNSSSIDDPPRKQTEISQKSDVVKDNENKQTEIVKSEVEPKLAQAEIQPDLKYKTTIKSETTEIDKPYPRDVKSKVVYILNDEDIFNTSPINKLESTNKDLTTETSKKSQNLDSNVGISTLGKVYDSTITKNDETAKNIKSSLFGDENDDDDDEEIFKGKSKTVKKTTIFDSDSEDELFGNKKERKAVEKKVEVKKEVKREVVKGSLFGDDDDDDDLFGVKTKKSVAHQKPHTSKPAVKETPKPTEPVFEDPLSMFGDDD